MADTYSGMDITSLWYRSVWDMGSTHKLLTIINNKKIIWNFLNIYTMVSHIILTPDAHGGVAFYFTIFYHETDHLMFDSTVCNIFFVVCEILEQK